MLTCNLSPDGRRNLCTLFGSLDVLVNALQDFMATGKDVLGMGAL